MSFHFRPLVVTTSLIAMVLGCTDSATRPTGSSVRARATGVPDVELSLVVQPLVGGPSQPVSIEIIALHTGVAEVWRCDGCGCGNSIALEVRGPDGTAVALTDPAAPRPLCPDVFLNWQANASVRTEERFTGTLYEKDGSKSPTPTYDAPAGTYTVVARFDYATSRDGEHTRVERSTTFVWNP